MNKTTIAGIVAIGLLIVGLLAFSLGNYVGRPSMMVNGRIDDVDYKPRHRCGTTKSGETTKPKYCAESWKVEVAYLDQIDRQTRTTRPPSWMREGAQVRVRYVTGRWSRSPMVIGVDRG